MELEPLIRVRFGLVAIVGVTGAVFFPQQSFGDKLTMSNHCDVCQTSGDVSVLGATEHQRRYGYSLRGSAGSITEEEEYYSHWDVQILESGDDQCRVEVTIRVEHTPTPPGGERGETSEVSFTRQYSLVGDVELSESFPLVELSGGYEFSLLYDPDYESPESTEPPPAEEPRPDTDCRISVSTIHSKYEVERREELLACFGEAVESGEFDLTDDQQVRIRFGLTPEGDPADFEVVDSDYEDTGLASCLDALIQSVEFGPTLCDTKKFVVYPFMPDVNALKKAGKWEIPQEPPSEPPVSDSLKM